METISIIPKSMEELYSDLMTVPKNNLIFGGGTDLVIKMRDRHLEPEAVIYLGDIPETKEIKQVGNQIEIGASVTMTQAEKNPLIKEKLTALYHAAKDVGSVQIRNKATVIGNIGSASPAGDIMPVMFLYNAIIEVVGPGGKIRQVPIRDFVLGKGKIDLQYNEVMSKIIIPVNDNKNYKSAFFKLGSRKKVTISRIGMAVSAIFDDDKNVLESKIYLGAVSPKPMHIEAGEKLMIGRKIDQKVKDEISDIAFQMIYDITPKGFERHDAQYYERHYRYYKPYSVRGVVEDVFDILLAL